MTQRSKNRILIIGGVLLLCIAYQYGIAKTIRIRKQVAALEQQKQVYQNTPMQLATLASTEKQLDAILAQHNIEGVSIQQHMLKTLNTLAETSNFKVIAFEKPHQYQDPDTQNTTTTYQFTISGDYQSLISVVYAFEQHYSFGNIIQVNFDKTKAYRSKKVALNATILIQRL